MEEALAQSRENATRSRTASWSNLKSLGVRNSREVQPLPHVSKDSILRGLTSWSVGRIRMLGWRGFQHRQSKHACPVARFKFGRLLELWLSIGALPL
jgi:hypothetical protein